MPAPPAVVKKLARQREIDGDRWVFRFENGLVVHTDAFMRDDPARILPVGGPQDAILSRLASLPQLVAGKRVLEPFAGSGVLGLMALRLGAGHVDFLDINPRAQSFQTDNARRNGFASERFRAILQSIADFEPEQPYDQVHANPPFVPTPAGIAGTLTSAGGPEGNDLVAILLAKLARLLRPDGEAYVYVMQLVTAEGRPLVADLVERHLPARSVALTPTQAEPGPLSGYLDAYLRYFPLQATEVERWAESLRATHGEDVGMQHYLMHVQPERPGPASWALTTDLLAKYGQLPYPAWSLHDLALARVMENVLPPSQPTATA
jgi:SAM-dependent methyltransferase